MAASGKAPGYSPDRSSTRIPWSGRRQPTQFPLADLQGQFGASVQQVQESGSANRSRSKLLQTFVAQEVSSTICTREW